MTCPWVVPSGRDFYWNNEGLWCLGGFFFGFLHDRNLCILRFQLAKERSPPPLPSRSSYYSCTSSMGAHSCCESTQPLTARSCPAGPVSVNGIDHQPFWSLHTNKFMLHRGSIRSTKLRHSSRRRSRQTTSATVLAQRAHFLIRTAWFFAVLICKVKVAFFGGRFKPGIGRGTNICFHPRWKGRKLQNKEDIAGLDGRAAELQVKISAMLLEIISAHVQEGGLVYNWLPLVLLSCVF